MAAAGGAAASGQLPGQQQPEFGLQWSPDGKFLIFETSQRTETPQVVRVDLVPKQPKFAEEKFDDLFKPEAAARAAGARRRAAAEPKAAVKVEIEFDDIRERLTVLNTAGLTVNNPMISPDGKYLLYSGTAGGQANLYLYPLEEDAAGRGGRGGGGGGGRGGAAVRPGS